MANDRERNVAGIVNAEGLISEFIREIGDENGDLITRTEQITGTRSRSGTLDGGRRRGGRRRLGDKRHGNEKSGKT
jgi:hypothetical protein